VGLAVIYCTVDHCSPEPSPESFQQGALQFCGGALRLFGGAWHLKINQNSFIVFHVSIWGAYSFVLGDKPTKAPVATGLL